jgi:hypothetical protein
LFEAYLENGEIILAKADWLPVEYEYSSREYDKNDSEVTFLPIIVQSNHFEELIGLIGKWIDSSNSLFAKELKQIRFQNKK